MTPQTHVGPPLIDQKLSRGLRDEENFLLGSCCVWPAFVSYQVWFELGTQENQVRGERNKNGYR